MKDFFRPPHNPARLIYDAFQKEAEKRESRDIVKSIEEERLVVWNVTMIYAHQHGLYVPTLEDIAICESHAMGHCDYGAKWAYGIVDLLKT